MNVPEGYLRRGPTRRLLVMPAVLIVLLAVVPWVLEYVEERVLPPRFDHVAVAFDSLITLLLGVWIVSMIRREQETMRRHLDEFERLSLTDPLTGLGNRRAFERDLEVALRRSERMAGPLAILYLDVDALKHVNDRHGHAAGDETLRCMGAVLRSSSRLGLDSAYRVGGDEFVMVLTAEIRAAEMVAERIARRFEERSPHDSRVSSGVVMWDGESRLHQLIEEADTRMYRRKQHGFRPAPV
jgi:diguanylate cyclase (GGDEF)-like protein